MRRWVAAPLDARPARRPPRALTLSPCSIRAPDRGMGINIGGMGDGCVDNVTFRDVLLDHPSLMGAEIKTENGNDDRSYVANVLYQNITFRDALNATNFPCIEITAAYTGDGHGYAGKYLPKVSNVTYRDVDARGCSQPITLTCNASQPCENVAFAGVRTDVYPRLGLAVALSHGSACAT